ncbi:transposase [Intrasporangium oryzae]|uniref:transposase n=1 Tax=Intrasporangium oryzae TaxID=412687 RepID=UPI0004AE1F49|nr:transposase [Intrasporangium oryzae]
MTQQPPRPNRRYDDAFRAAAVERASAAGVTVSATAAELGVSVSTLRRWVRAHEQAAREAEQQAQQDSRREHAVRGPEPPPDQPPDPPPEQPPEQPPDPPHEQPASDRPTFAQPAAAQPRALPRRDPPPAPHPNPVADRAAALSAEQAYRPSRHTQNADRAALLALAPEPEWHVLPGQEAHETVLLPSDDIFPALARIVPAYRFPIILLALVAAVAISTVVPADYPGRPVVLALHVVSLIVAFGTVLVIDWHGLLWLAGRRHLMESTRIAAASGPMIWAGLAGLIATGAFLHPDLTAPRTVVKLLLVLAVAWNGAAMSVFRRRLARLPPDTTPGQLPRTDWRILVVSTTISQIGWWGAMTIGFITSSGRR